MRTYSRQHINDWQILVLLESAVSHRHIYRQALEILKQPPAERVQAFNKLALSWIKEFRTTYEYIYPNEETTEAFARHLQTWYEVP